MRALNDDCCFERSVENRESQTSELQICAVEEFGFNVLNSSTQNPIDNTSIKTDEWEYLANCTMCALRSIT